MWKPISVSEAPEECHILLRRVCEVLKGVNGEVALNVLLNALINVAVDVELDPIEQLLAILRTGIEIQKAMVS